MRSHCVSISKKMQWFSSFVNNDFPKVKKQKIKKKVFWKLKVFPISLFFLHKKRKPIVCFFLSSTIVAYFSLMITKRWSKFLLLKTYPFSNPEAYDHWISLKILTPWKYPSPLLWSIWESQDWKSPKLENNPPCFGAIGQGLGIFKDIQWSVRFQNTPKHCNRTKTRCDR